MKFKKGTPEYIEFRRKANESDRRYNAKPEVKVRKRIYKKQHDKENKEKISKYGYELRARPKTQERIRKWREENKEHLIQQGKEWREKNKERKKIMDREYFLKNRKRVNEVSRNWRNKNKNIVKKYNQKYYTSPKGKINYTKHNHRRLALIKERPFDLTKEKIEEIFRRDKVCVYCGSDKKLELDHIVPLKLGGNSLFNNFVVACKKCNTSKNARDVFYWCKLMNRDVPKIVLELLKSQGVQI